MSRQYKENRHIPVPQGERGILRAWPGQLRHLPSPVVGIMAALYYREDRWVHGLGVSGAGADRDHKCGQWTGEGTAGDREDQGDAITVKM